MAAQLLESAFGKNDIRGIYGKDITEELFYYIGKGFVQYIGAKSRKTPAQMWITVTQDARNHSPALAKALINGVVSTGANVVDLGLAPTPIGYYSEVVGIDPSVKGDEEITGALIITASHNPSQYNGLKMTFNKQSLNEFQIKEVKEYTLQEAQKAVLSTNVGSLKHYDLIPDYVEVMKKNFGRVGEGIKVVVDSANATGGVVAPNLYRALGCQVVELYSSPNGNFPHHHPNPSDERTLTYIKKKVLETGADFGIAFDGDADRIGVIDSKGKSMTGDKLLLIYAQDVIEKLKDAPKKPIIVSEVKCSQVLYDKINELGGEAVMCKTGHGFIKGKMKETGAVLAGEMSGHIFFKDRYHGFDDAVYAGCRIIEIVANKKRENPDFKIEQLLKPFDEVFSSQEVRFPCPDELKRPTLKDFERIVNKNPDLFGEKIKEIVTLDGLRIIFDGGFAIIRQSNTEPVFTLRFEAKTQEKAQHYEDVMLGELKKILKV
ncbi:MAG TPA: phosphomannomutase/phosphoglucomutase [Candidatus Gastranaerophilaceae bacterium]|nr:phosphomannomutase/phosphoglucomutase [Candidatus Gastranaerophilaceae bacterium]HPT41366.1 phosphomannomutase/phosphoglucomutase [Candidatus Gastranaerophilaceae bacterium]